MNSLTRRTLTFVALLLTVVSYFCDAVHAHEVRPAVATITLDQRTDVSITLNLEAFIVGIGAEHKDTDDAPEAKLYAALRALPPDALKARFTTDVAKWQAGVEVVADGKALPLSVTDVAIASVGDVALARRTVIHLSGPLGAPATALSFRYGHAPGAILRIMSATGEAIEGGWLKQGQASPTLAIGSNGEAASKLARFVDYVVLGFTHIVPKGLDHILFVLGLFLLSRDWKTLLVQVTAFTVAHSITLALGLLDIVEVSPRIVEPLIALSIAYVAIENLVSTELRPWRPYLVFLFGLLHGLGFAEILRDAAITGPEFLTALIGFNLGVEFGQLAVISIAWLATAFWLGEQRWYRARVVRPACLAIALMGCFWTVERLGMF